MASVLPMICLLTTVTLTSGSSPCDFDLVTGPHGVSDDAITASSIHYSCPINTARINSSNAWCSASSLTGNYLQVEFQKISFLKAITTKGREAAPQWLKSYKASTSMDGLKWMYILNSTGDIQVFPGNVDHVTAVTNNLEGSVIAKFIRIYPLTYQWHMSMRMEVKGCPAPCSSYFSTCDSWKAKLGSNGDLLPLLLDTNASNPGRCGVHCKKHADCESFLFDITTAQCRLLRSTSNGSSDIVNLDGVRYFVKP